MVNKVAHVMVKGQGAHSPTLTLLIELQGLVQD